MVRFEAGEECFRLLAIRIRNDYAWHVGEAHRILLFELFDLMRFPRVFCRAQPQSCVRAIRENIEKPKPPYAAQLAACSRPQAAALVRNDDETGQVHRTGEP